jgi:hypothetical protein
MVIFCAPRYKEEAYGDDYTKGLGKDADDGDALFNRFLIYAGTHADDYEGIDTGKMRNMVQMIRRNSEKIQKKVGISTISTNDTEENEHVEDLSHDLTYHALLLELRDAFHREEFRNEIVENFGERQWGLFGFLKNPEISRNGRFLRQFSWKCENGGFVPFLPSKNAGRAKIYVTETEGALTTWSSGNNPDELASFKDLNSSDNLNTSVQEENSVLLGESQSEMRQSDIKTRGRSDETTMMQINSNTMQSSTDNNMTFKQQFIPSSQIVDNHVPVTRTASQLKSDAVFEKSKKWVQHMRNSGQELGGKNFSFQEYTAITSWVFQQIKKWEMKKMEMEEIARAKTGNGGNGKKGLSLKEDQESVSDRWDINTDPEPFIITQEDQIFQMVHKLCTEKFRQKLEASVAAGRDERSFEWSYTLNDKDEAVGTCVEGMLGKMGVEVDKTEMKYDNIVMEEVKEDVKGGVKKGVNLNYGNQRVDQEVEQQQSLRNDQNLMRNDENARNESGGDKGEKERDNHQKGTEREGNDRENQGENAKHEPENESANNKNEGGDESEPEILNDDTSDSEVPVHRSGVFRRAIGAVGYGIGAVVRGTLDFVVAKPVQGIASGVQTVYNATAGSRSLMRPFTKVDVIDPRKARGSEATLAAESIVRYLKHVFEEVEKAEEAEREGIRRAEMDRAEVERAKTEKTEAEQRVQKTKGETCRKQGLLGEQKLDANIMEERKESEQVPRRPGMIPQKKNDLSQSCYDFAEEEDTAMMPEKIQKTDLSQSHYDFTLGDDKKNGDLPRKDDLKTSHYDFTLGDDKKEGDLPRKDDLKMSHYDFTLGDDKKEGDLPRKDDLKMSQYDFGEDKNKEECDLAQEDDNNLDHADDLSRKFEKLTLNPKKSISKDLNHNLDSKLNNKNVNSGSQDSRSHSGKKSTQNPLADQNALKVTEQKPRNTQYPLKYSLNMGTQLKEYFEGRVNLYFPKGVISTTKGREGVSKGGEAVNKGGVVKEKGGCQREVLVTAFDEDMRKFLAQHTEYENTEPFKRKLSGV